MYLLLLSFSVQAAELQYHNGLSLDFGIAGTIDKTVTNKYISYVSDDRTWLQYFDDRQTESDPLSYQFSIYYNHAFLPFMSLEIGGSGTFADEDTYTKYAIYDFEEFSERFTSLSFVSGLKFNHRFVKLFNIYCTPRFELVTDFHKRQFTLDSDESIEISYFTKPAFSMQSGFEFIPGGNFFGISAFITFRFLKSQEETITMINDYTFIEKIEYPPIQTGVKLCFYFK